MNPKLWQIMSALALGPQPSYIMSADGDAGGDNGGGGGGGGDPPKTFTQVELDGIIEKRLAKERNKFSDYDEIKARAGKVGDLETQLAEINEKIELSGKTEKEKAEAQAEKERRVLEQQIEALKTESATAKEGQVAAEGRWRQDRIHARISSALVEAKAVTSDAALRQATRLLAAEGKAELGEDGESIALEIGDARFTDPVLGAKQWLQGNPHFAAHPGGGAGSRPSTGNLPSNLDDLSGEELADLGWRQQPA